MVITPPLSASAFRRPAATWPSPRDCRAPTRVLLLDEPLSALDAQIRHNMVEEIARLHREELPELTILCVTHDQTGSAFTGR